MAGPSSVLLFVVRVEFWGSTTEKRLSRECKVCANGDVEYVRQVVSPERAYQQLPNTLSTSTYTLHKTHTHLIQIMNTLPTTEPILLPKLRIQFADFPYDPDSIRLEATHLGDLLRFSVRLMWWLWRFDFSRIVSLARTRCPIILKWYIGC